jgi:hypothetical protein
MAASDIIIRYDGTDITSSVIFSSASFAMQVSAVPGEFSFSCKDETQTLSFITGKEITLDVDGVRLWGGYLLNVGYDYAFDVDEIPANPDQYTNRKWNLRGMDYNILFDKRVIRNTANYLSSIDTGLPLASTFDGTAIKYILANYVDGLSGFNIEDDIDDVRTLAPSTASDSYILQQGEKLRKVFQTASLRSGAVWYISPDKRFQWHALEDVESRWGLSDVPNNGPITASPNEFQGVTIGPRAIEATEDGSFIINDALVWGGSQFAGAGSTVFARTQDATSQSTHGRWQLAETHFGELGYGIQDGVTERADVIVNGLPGADALGQLKGLRYSQWTFHLDWFAHDVPLLSGSPRHLLPGDLVTIELQVFGVTGAQIRLLPLRTLRMRFPNLDPAGDAYVQFSGEFSLNLSDPFTLWRYILQAQQRIAAIIPISTSDDSSTSFQYGSIGSFTPTPAPNGSVTVFSLPVGYIAGTLRVSLNGLDQTPGDSFIESDPNAGEFTMIPAPLVTDWLHVICRTLEG